MSSSRLKSSVKGNANGIGIEFTASAFSAVCLERESGFLSIAGIASAPIVNGDGEDELSHALRKLARGDAHQGNGQDICISLPPLASTELIHVIPENLPKDALEKIVQGHVSQVVSSSDVEFIHGFQVMDSCVDAYRNAIISMARSTVVEQHCDMLRPYHFKSHKVTSHPLALASAFFALHTKIAEAASPQVLLFLEEESTAMTIVSNGGVQYSTWLAFGSRNMSVSLNRKERNGRQVLKDEFENAIARWREILQAAADEQQITVDMAVTAKVDNIWYSGALDDMERFSEMLSSVLPDARIGAFGIPGNMLPTPDETLHTELTIPFGLALQSIGEPPMNISLLPQRLKWIEHKEKEYLYLSISSILLIFGMLALMLGILTHVNRSIYALERESSNLRNCATLIPQLEKYHERMTFHQKEMLPVAESLHRTHRFLEALTLWNTAEKTSDDEERSWGIYLADEISFERSNSIRENAEEPRVQTPARQANAAMDLFASEPAKPQEAQPSPRIHYVNVDNIRTLKGMFIGGIVPLGKSRYKIVKDIQTQLVDSGVYVNVDDHSDSLSQKFTDAYYAPWLTFLQKNRDALQSEYTTFLMKLPFKEEFIKTDYLNTPPPKGGRK